MILWARASSRCFLLSCSCPRRRSERLRLGREMAWLSHCRVAFTSVLVSACLVFGLLGAEGPGRGWGWVCSGARGANSGDFTGRIDGRLNCDHAEVQLENEEIGRFKIMCRRRAKDKTNDHASVCLARINRHDVHLQAEDHICFKRLAPLSSDWMHVFSRQHR